MSDADIEISGYDIIVPDQQEAKLVPTVVSRGAELIAQQHRVASFRGRAMVEVYEPFAHFVPLNKDRFEAIAYPILGGISRTKINDIFAYLANVAEDLTPNENYISFGLTEQKDGKPSKNYSENASTMVWDMEAVDWAQVFPSDCVWRSPYGYVAVGTDKDKKRSRIPFIMQLAGGDEGVYDDIMQSLAPLVMAKKPDGAVWWVGAGANGKSTLMDAIYKIFPGQLSSITVKRLTDGRDTPSLNGTLANVVKESSEGRIDDTEVYKSIGTHENFRVHKFHSQDDIEIRGNVHHIFSANIIPSFNDKGYAAKRRTCIIPFTQKFESDPDFERNNFTSDFFGQLVTEMCHYARKLKAQGYRYKWSAKTRAAKAEYDAEAGNTEEYAKEIIDQGVVAFDSFNPIRMDYENWCAENGFVPLGIGNLRRSILALGFDRISIREGDKTDKRYRLPNFENHDLMPLGNARPGIWTVRGFAPQDNIEVPEFKQPEPEVPKKSILNNRW